MKLCLTSVSCFIRVTLHKMCLKCVVGSTELISGQSYKQFTLVIYNSIVIIWGIFKSGTTLESKITIVVLYKIGHRSLTVSFYAKLQLLQFFYLIYLVLFAINWKFNFLLIHITIFMTWVHIYICRAKIFFARKQLN